MVGLLDIAELHEVVMVRGSEVKVTGVSAKGIAYLLDKFPTIRKLIAERDDVKTEDIVAMAPDAVAAAIAAGCGNPGDQEAERVAAGLAVAEQLDLLEAVVRLTFPKGVGPFVEKLTLLAAGAAQETPQGFVADAPGREPGMRLPAQSKR